MIIKEKSLIGYYYKWMFHGQLPQDFCTLFWNSLFSFLLLPLTVPFFLYSIIFDREIWNKNLLSKSYRGLLTYFGLFVAFFVGLATFQKVFGEAWRKWDFFPVLGAAVVGLLIIIVVVFSVLIGFCILHFLWDTITNIEIVHNKVIKPKEQKIVILWNTIRKKYCTKIKWE